MAHNFLQKEEKHIALLYNGAAGNGNAINIVALIEEYLQKENISFNSFNRIWPAALEPFTEVWIVGGDGTFHFFINFYKSTNIPVAFFPGGTGNDICWLLYGEQPFESYLSIALSPHTRLMDIINCNEILTLNAVGIGFDGEVVRTLQDNKKKPGKASYLATVIKKIFSYQSRTYSVSFANHTIHGKFLLIDICNGKRTGGGFLIAPMANAFDNQLDMVMVKKISIVKRLLNLSRIEKGKHLDLPFVTHNFLNEVSIESDKEMSLHLDGEYYRYPTIKITIAPQKLMVKYPLPN